MYKVLPLFKSHYSLGRSILTLEKPTGKPDSYPISVFDLLQQNKLDTLVLVEDNISGLLQASKYAEELKIKLVFGLRIDVTEDMAQKDEASLGKRAKFIVFAKNSKGYVDLIKIWSTAAKEGFYYNPVIDFKTLKALWTKNMFLAVPFYDSFLYSNAFEGHVHVPHIESFKPTFFIEDNDLPFDDILKAKVEAYCKGKYDTLQTQSIFYKSEEDFPAYLTFRCIHNRGTSQKCTLEKPELRHMGSSGFNFEKWLELNAQ